MGLGKTLELISLLLTTLPSIPVVRPPPSPPPPSSNKNNKPRYPFLPGALASPPSVLPPVPGGNVPSRATLVVCPLSTVGNWEEQMGTHVEEGVLKVLVYHGGGRERVVEEVAKYVSLRVAVFGGSRYICLKIEIYGEMLTFVPCCYHRTSLSRPTIFLHWSSAGMRN